MRQHSEIQLFGIFGNPLTHTLSPAMQEAAFAALDLNAYYLVFGMDTVHFKKTMKGLARLLLSGFNVTVPYKETVIAYLDRLTPEARAVGAVNTVFKKGKHWIGANTDVYGFLESLQQAKFNVRHKKVLILGAGGAARAAVYGLAKAGADEIHIFNRHPRRTKKIIQDFGKIFAKTKIAPSLQPSLPAGERGKERNQVSFPLAPLGRGKGEGMEILLEDFDLVVNATSLGLKSEDPSPISDSWIPRASKKRLLFYDLIYHVAETPFLKSARKKGHRILNGVEMLVHQGAKALEYWTGRKAPVGVMRKAFIKELKK